MRRFEIIEHTADVGIAAYGKSREELFANAAIGMFHIIGDQAQVEPHLARQIHVHADDQELLLAAFLSELLYLFEVEHFVLHDAAITRLSDTEVEATLHGEPISSKHDLCAGIKAVTHHDLTVTNQDGVWRATVLFDV